MRRGVPGAVRHRRFRRVGHWPYLAVLVLAAIALAGCGGGTGVEGANADSGPARVSYSGRQYVGMDPALTTINPQRVVPLGNASEVSGAGIDGKAIYGLGPDTRDAIGMKTTSGEFMLFLREEAGEAITLEGYPEICRLFKDPSSQPGC